MLRRKPLRRKTPLRKARRVKSLRKRLWPEFSKLIRKRDGRCLRGPKGCGGLLAASHIWPKGSHPLLELHPKNCLTLCYVHHIHWWHKNPVEAANWLVTFLSSSDWMEMSQLPVTELKRKRMTEDEIRAEWKAYGL